MCFALPSPSCSEKFVLKTLIAAPVNSERWGNLRQPHPVLPPHNLPPDPVYDSHKLCPGPQGTKGISWPTKEARLAPRHSLIVGLNENGAGIIKGIFFLVSPGSMNTKRCTSYHRRKQWLLSFTVVVESADRPLPGSPRY